MKFIDLTGQRFGSVEVISRAPTVKKRTMWNCKCDCGKEFVSESYRIRKGQVKSCGCKINRSTDLTNKRFGKLIALELIKEEAPYKDHLYRRYWKCKCDCGSYTTVREDRLKSGETQSCGCLKSKGELKISNLLSENNINFSTQYSFNDLKSYNGVVLKFDFAIFENNKLQYLIEFDGEQHFYEAPHRGFYTKEVIDGIIKRDAIKNKYCKENNIPLIRIPYTRLNELNISDLNINTSKFIV